MLAGIEVIKTIENVKPDHVNKTETIYGKIIGETQNPDRLQADLKIVFLENPNLRDQYNKASESESSVQKAMVRGKIMEKVIERMSNPHFDNVQTQASVSSEKGNKHITDYTGYAKERISFSGNRSDQVNQGEKVSFEYKAGGQNYLDRELRGHGKEQASAHEGKSVIVVSKDFHDLPIHKQKELRQVNREQGTTIIVALPRVSVIDTCIEKALSSQY